MENQKSFVLLGSVAGSRRICTRGNFFLTHFLFSLSGDYLLKKRWCFLFKEEDVDRRQCEGMAWGGHEAEGEMFCSDTCLLFLAFIRK